jgi:hypothetical protein
MDERDGKMSASKVEAVVLCPAYLKANQKFEWLGDRSAADEGTARHLNEEEQTPIDEIGDEDRRRCAIQSRKALQWCRETLEIDGKIEREARLWWDEDWSGQLDYMELEGNRAFIADYKMLRGDHEPADKNVQLQAQGALVVKNYPEIEEVFLALIEPFNDPTYTTVCYSKDFLLAKGALFTNASRYALEPNPPAVAGKKQCKWCSAQPFCPALRELLTMGLMKYELA